MPWPTVAVVTTGMDADTDTLPRADILDHTNKFNQLIAMRGVADGVCDLGATAQIPTARLPGQLATLSSLSAQQATDVSGLSAFIGTLLNDVGQGAALATLGAPLNGIYGKSAAYTVVAADRGRWLHCSDTFTVSLTALATLGPHFTFAVKNSGIGTITIDPAGTETIDGVASLALAPGESCVVISGGAAESWYSLGLDSSSFSANRSLASNGYQRLPGGLIIQWGVGAAGANYTNFTNNYPVAFPTAAFMIAATHEGGGAANSHINANKVSLSQFNMTTGHTANVGAFFIAVGY